MTDTPVKANESPRIVTAIRIVRALPSLLFIANVEARRQAALDAPVDYWPTEKAGSSS